MSRNKDQAPAGSLFQIFISETNAEPPELLGQSVTKGRSGPLLPAVWVGPLVSGMSTSASSWPDPGPVQEGWMEPWEVLFGRGGRSWICS